MNTRLLIALALVAPLADACSGPSAPGASADPGAVDKLIAECEQCPTDDELRRAAATPEQFSFVKRVNALETALTGRPLSAGNHVDLLLDGPQTHDAQLDAIRHARHHIHLITYIMTDDKLAHRYLEALQERRAHGVTVRFMFDSVGSRTVGQPFRDALTRAGVEVREYGPINPAKSGGKDWKLSQRHHRKILVVDGRVAFTGGINISDEYRQASAGVAGSSSKEGGGWRDTHIRIEGPGVAEFQRMFFESWEEGGAEKVPDRDSPQYWPKLARRGDDFVRGVNQQGNDVRDIALQSIGLGGAEDPSKHTIYGSYLAAIQSAHQKIWITQAYFIPNHEFMDMLEAAARRGVDVRVLVPSTSDIKMMVYASRYHYGPLLEADAHIYEYSGPMLHSKTAVIDGVWATVGSSNLDYRSFIHNDEANAIVIGHEFGTKMEKMYLDDLANSKEITRAEWEKRSFAERAKQRMAALLKYWI